MDPRQLRLVRTETVIATCLCSVLPSLAMVFLFDGLPIAPWGAEGLVAFAAKGSSIPVAIMTIAMTLGTRGKVAKGAVPQLPGGSFALLRLVPGHVVLRALLFAAAAGALLSAATAVGVWAIDPAPLQRPAFVAFNLLLGAAIGLLMTPLIQCAALADTPARAATVRKETA